MKSYEQMKKEIEMDSKRIQEESQRIKEKYEEVERKIQEQKGNNNNNNRLSLELFMEVTRLMEQSISDAQRASEEAATNQNMMNNMF